MAIGVYFFVVGRGLAQRSLSNQNNEEKTFMLENKCVPV